MKFIKTVAETATESLHERLKIELAKGKRVLWLISGGSAISAEAEIIGKLSESKSANNLTIMLMDERFGLSGHENSNWQQLKETNCKLEPFHCIEVLSDDNASLAETAHQYEVKLEHELTNAEIVIGLFGLGSDGHTAGILPNSDATKPTNDLVASYHTEQFDRITLCKYALQKVHVAYMFAFGEAKKQALERLFAGTEDFTSLPAILVKDIPEVYIYNDQLGEAL